ncbi:TIM barrel protein [Roseimicrobium sp. ORNL1]|uniref:sugar phosphate isomerase/epimerase family protein n=1 Tax=Roseimicrobium sp. ORNL1 TaxID=2711231 RepID=UPI0013E0FAA0|nr:TIM barrel protein [Roseimicrobium sp. ORNL1]QIF03343.1 sugar phosphate isomerase/epimerase [Roseimicrobium sp. ORNL1]
MLSLSSCWNSHRHEDGKHIAHEAKSLGFKYIELSHGLKISHLPGIIQVVAESGIKISSVHNFCPPPVEVMMDAPDAFEFTSHKEEERLRALTLTEQTMETASRLGAQRVVLHLGSIPISPLTRKLEELTLAGKIYSREYTKVKLELVAKRAKHAQVHFDRARHAIDRLLPLCEQYRVALGIETRSHFEEVPTAAEMLQLVDQYRGSPWVGFWHDFGHVQRQANLGLLDHAQFLSEIAPRLLGCHVHDVDWPAKDHRVPLSTGGVDFAKLMPLIPKGIPLVWEMHRTQRRSHVRERLAEWREKFGEWG